MTRGVVLHQKKCPEKTKEIFDEHRNLPCVCKKKSQFLIDALSKKRSLVVLTLEMGISAVKKGYETFQPGLDSLMIIVESHSIV